jgi:hypothetical protein
MLAVMILALIAAAIYRFVVADLGAIRISTEDTARKNATQALIAVLKNEFANLPVGEQNAFLGEAHKFNDKSSDQVEWITQAGNGLFTQAASGEWKVTLLLKPDDGANTYSLGLLRQVANSNTKDENWLPLLHQIDAIEIRYYDQNQNTWVDRWANGTNPPALVRVRIWRLGDDIPYETVIPFPPTRIPA